MVDKAGDQINWSEVKSKFEKKKPKTTKGREQRRKMGNGNGNENVSPHRDLPRTNYIRGRTE